MVTGCCQGWSGHWQRPVTTWVYKPETVNSLKLLMMSGMPLETCWAFNKLRNNKFYYKAASCWYFYWVIYDARIHEYQIYMLSNRLVHTTTCFGPVYWPSSGCTINLTSSYTIRAWGTVGGTRSRLTVVGDMASVLSWTGLNIICQCLKADSHIACRAHAVPLPCRAANGLECVFPNWFTQCGRVWFIKM
jgi:hypothetical protein